VEQKVYESVTTRIENSGATIKGIILTGSVADILVRSPFTVSLEHIVMIWQKQTS
jgi:hypothetical protein